MMKKKILIITALLLIVGGICILLYINSAKIDLSSYKYSNLKEYFINNGYELKSNSLFDNDMVWLTNNKIGFIATFDKENHHTKYITYENSDISSSNCNIWNNSQNTTEESQKIYSDFVKWLEKYNLKDWQIIDLLVNYYYETFNIKSN